MLNKPSQRKSVLLNIDEKQRYAAIVKDNWKLIIGEYFHRSNNVTEQIIRTSIFIPIEAIGMYGLDENFPPIEYKNQTKNTSYNG